MKTEVQIRDKIAEHENLINDLLDEISSEYDVNTIEMLLVGRKALLWVLSNQQYLEKDLYEKDVRFECACYDSTKIF